MCDEGITPNCNAHVVCPVLMWFWDILRWGWGCVGVCGGYTHPINATSKRAIVLLRSYKYIKRCLPLIYSNNCLCPRYGTLHHIWQNGGQDLCPVPVPGWRPFFWFINISFVGVKTWIIYLCHYILCGHKPVRTAAPAPQLSTHVGVAVVVNWF